MAVRTLSTCFVRRHADRSPSRPLHRPPPVRGHRTSRRPVFRPEPVSIAQPYRAASHRRHGKGLAQMRLAPARRHRREMEPMRRGIVSKGWRREPESNRCTRICSPLHHHSAIAPPKNRFSWRAGADSATRPQGQADSRAIVAILGQAESSVRKWGCNPAPGIVIAYHSFALVLSCL